MLHKFLIASALAFVALTSSLRAQCRDFADGFTATQFGFSNSFGSTVFDDGTGPALYASGFRLGRNGLWKWIGGAEGWSAFGPALQFSANEIVVFDDGTGPTLYLAFMSNSTGGGSFTPGVMRWTGVDFVRVGNPGPDDDVEALCVHDDGSGPALYAGGRFLLADGNAAARVARWDGTNWSAVGSGTNGLVRTLTSFGAGAQARLIVGGEFTMAGGVAASRVAQWNGTAWTSLGSGVSGGSFVGVNDLHVADIGAGPLLYVGGTFTTAGGSPATNVARWTGSSWFGIPGFPTGGVITIGDWDDGSGPGVYVAGPTSFGGLVTNGIARWNGSAWSALSTGLVANGNGGVKSFAKSPLEGVERLWMFGGMTEAGGKPISGVAVWGQPCSAPIVTLAPFDVLAQLPDPITLRVESAGTAPISYQWRHEGVPLVDGPLVGGATTKELMLFTWSLDQAGAYDCVLTNAQGMTVSSIAHVTVPTGAPGGVLQPLTARLAPGDTTSTLDPLTRANSGVGVADGAVHASGIVDFGGLLREAWLTWRTGLITTQAVRGDPAPGFPAGSTLDRSEGSPFEQGDHATAGRLTFRSFVLGPGVTNANDEAIFYRDDLGVSLVVRQGDPAPGISATAYFQDLQVAPILASDGSVLVNARYRDGTAIGYGAWSWTAGGGLQLLHASGEVVPGSAETFSDVSAGLLLPTGEHLISGAYAAGTKWGVWIDVAGSLVPLAVPDDPAPGFPMGSVFSGVSAMSVNASGDVLLRGTVRNGGFDQIGLYVWSAGSLTPVAIHGEVLAGSGPNDVMNGLAPLGFNDSGHVLFSTVLDGPCSSGCPNRAIVLWRSGILTIVTLNRVSPAGISPSTAIIQSFSYGALDAMDRVAFGALLTPSGNGTSVFGWTDGIGVFPVAMAGQQVALSSGLHATLLSAAMGSGSGAHAPALSGGLDAPGEIVVNVALTNPAGSGVYTASWTDLLTLYGACPVVSTATPNVWVPPAQTAVLSVLATGGSPLSYRWAKEGIDLFDGGGVTGTDTPTLSIANASPADSATYSARVWNPCGSVDGPPIVLDVAPGIPFCAGDNTGHACPCTPSGVDGWVGCLNSLGVGGKLRSSGVASLTADTLGLIGSQMPNSSALYFQGTGQAGSGAGTTFGDGLRCVAGTVVRIGIRLNTGGGSAYPIGGDAPVSVRGLVSAPGLRNYQTWYRNAASFCTSSTFNLTNGLAVTWIP